MSPTSVAPSPSVEASHGPASSIAGVCALKLTECSPSISGTGSLRSANAGIAQPSWTFLPIATSRRYAGFAAWLRNLTEMIAEFSRSIPTRSRVRFPIFSHRPDVSCAHVDGGFTVDLTRHWPKVLVTDLPHATVEDRREDADKSFLTRTMQSATWRFSRSSRARPILTVSARS